DAVAALDGPYHTVVVVTPRSMGAASSEFVPVDVNNAVRAGNRNADPVDALAGFVGALTGAAPEVEAAPSAGGTRVPLGGREDQPGDLDRDRTSGGSSSSAESSSGGGVSIWWFVGLGLVAMLGFSWWGKRKAARQQEANLEQARTEAKAQLSAIAQFVYDLNDRISLGDDDGLKTEFATASGDYQQLSELVDEADTGPELAELADKVDTLRWKMEAFEARLEGREPPPRPAEPRSRAEHRDDHDRIPISSRGRSRSSRTACFFDPQHRPGVVPATVEMDRESVDVLLCRDCSRRLRDGQQPDPRYVNVGRRKVPAALAPLGYGGLGLLLASLFNVRTNDMTQGVAFDWSSHVAGMPKPGSRPRAERLPTRPRRRRRGHPR
ncbi:MAG: hypothetical protein HKN26_01485, partial [Acidimicrobiales bacterium]|nr:hypothetical protein [Acidimicrobiales bacterium]